MSSASVTVNASKVQGAPNLPKGVILANARMTRESNVSILFRCIYRMRVLQVFRQQFLEDIKRKFFQ